MERRNLKRINIISIEEILYTNQNLSIKILNLETTVVHPPPVDDHSSEQNSGWMYKFRRKFFILFFTIESS